MLDTKDIKANYDCITRIGSGTFGDVYRATPVSSRGGVVAIKKLRLTEKISNPEYLREIIFFRTIPANTYLVRMYDMFVDSQSHDVCIELECMDRSLLKMMQEFGSQGSKMNPSLVGKIMMGVLGGLNHIHNYGFVHRDIKPENILVRHHGRRLEVKLADFGLSKPLGDTKWTGYVATRWYRAPEQLLHFPDHHTGIDIWAAGVVMCELCNVSPLFPGETVAQMTKLHIEALGMPGKYSLGGYAPQMAESLLNSDVENIAPSNSVFEDWFRFERHEVFVPLLRGTMQWDPDRRYTAKTMLSILNNMFQRSDEARMMTSSSAPTNASVVM